MKFQEFQFFDRRSEYVGTGPGFMPPGDPFIEVQPLTTCLF
jgi:hypothetical protein